MILKSIRSMGRDKATQPQFFRKESAMSRFWNEAISNQFAASIKMVRDAIELCPNNLWDDRTDGTPFWHIAYHTLFYCDLYLSDNLESYKARDFHVDNYHFLPGDYSEIGFGVVTTPDDPYSKAELLEYAGHCQEKCRVVLESLTDERVAERCGFWWYDLNVGEFLLNNLRHTQHHGAQLALILRRRADLGVEWVGTQRGETPE